MDETCRELLGEIKGDLKALDEKFDSLFRNGPITSLDKRMAVVEGKLGAVIGAGLLFGVPIIGYIGVEVFKHLFGP